MALELTEAAEIASEKIGIQPQIVLKIKGIEYLFGAAPIEKYVRIGDPGLLIGSTWTIGGLTEHEDSQDLIDLSGTGTKIQQQLMPDKGAVSSASSIKVSLVDAGSIVTQMISPGQLVDDLLGRRAQLYMGFQGTAWPEDFVSIFEGVIDEIESGAGNVSINLVHPDRKKQQQIFIRKDAELSGSMTNADTSVPVTGANTIFEFLPFGPAGDVDASISHFVRIDDEIIAYSGLNSTHLIGCTRGVLGTTAVAHSSAAKVQSFYLIEGPCMELALKLMLSGWNGNYIENEAILGIGPIPNLDPGTTTDFITLPPNVNAIDDYGCAIGDWVELSDTDDPGNSDFWMQVTAFGDFEGQSNRLIYVDYTLTKQSTANGTIGFRSQYDTLGQGLKLTPLEVDIDEHIRWSDLILNDFQYRFYLKDTIDGKDFLEKEIYMPYGAYAIPRKGRCSLGFHIGPLPQADIKILDQDVIKNPSKIRLRRTTSRNFYNAVTYQYDEDPLEDKFLTGSARVDADSQSRIPVGNAIFSVVSKGMRTDLEAVSKGDQAAVRRLNRYKFAAEFFENVEVFWKAGFNVEPGDLVIVDFTDLKVSNTTDGTREKPAKFFEVVNRTIDLKSGAVQLSLVDTNYDLSERYGLISPSSVISVGGSVAFFEVGESYGGYFGSEEWKKWDDYVGLKLLVHNEDFSFSEEVRFTGFDPSNKNRILLDPSTPLSMAAQAGWIVDIAEYPTDADPRNGRLYKLIHAHFSPEVDVVSGVSSTEFTVDPSDVSKFFVGAPIRVHSVDFATDSPEAKVKSIVGTTIESDTDLGFTPASGQKVSMLGFADQDTCYRWI